MSLCLSERMEELGGACGSEQSYGACGSEQSYSGGPAETYQQSRSPTLGNPDGAQPPEPDLQLYSGRWLPLSSKRLTKSHLQAMAEKLGLSTNTNDGKLIEQGREPGRVQVVLQETAKVELCLSLVDECGAFESCGPLLVSSAEDTHDSGKELEELDRYTAQLQDDLHAMQERVQEETRQVQIIERELRAEQSAHKELNVALQAERARVKQLWGRNCQQLSAHEAARKRSLPLKTLFAATG